MMINATERHNNNIKEGKMEMSEGVINSKYFSISDAIPQIVKEVVEIFEKKQAKISSEKNQMSSNEVLEILAYDLAGKGFIVEKGRKVRLKIGNTGLLFNPDACKAFDGKKFVLVIEESRAWSNYQFLKDLFFACMQKETEYLAIAVRMEYRFKVGGKTRPQEDHKRVLEFFEALYEKDSRIKLPLKGVLVIGY